MPPQNKPRFRIRRVIIAVAAIYLLYITMIAIFQSQLIFPAGSLGPALAPWRATGGDHLTLGPHGIDALYYPANEVGAAAVIIAHGNGERIEHWDQEATALREHCGVHVLLVEYPGYQGDEGSPSQASIRTGFVAGYDWLNDQPEVGAIHGLGLSIGTGVICDLATQRELASLALLAPFESLRGMARRRLVPDFLLRSPFDSAAVLRDYDGQVILVCAEEDEIFGSRHREALLRADPAAEVIIVPGGHNGVLSQAALYLPMLAEQWTPAERSN